VRSSRRRLLQLLATSSLLPHLHLPDGWVDAAYASAQSPASSADSDLITSAADALSVLDFEPVAKAKLPPWHWAWLSTGGDAGETMRANREGFDRYQIRARRLVDILSGVGRPAEIAVVAMNAGAAMVYSARVLDAVNAHGGG